MKDRLTAELHPRGGAATSSATKGPPRGCTPARAGALWPSPHVQAERSGRARLTRRPFFQIRNPYPLIRNLLAGEALSIFGSGKQTRDFTFIDDIVDANIAAAIEPKASGIYNIGGGSRVTLMEVLTTLADVMDVKLRVENLPEQAGDVKHTEADTTRARAELGYAPKIGLREGLTREVDWLKRDG